jgi:hypothetical protein
MGGERLDISEEMTNPPPLRNLIPFRSLLLLEVAACLDIGSIAQALSSNPQTISP